MARSEFSVVEQAGEAAGIREGAVLAILRVADLMTRIGNAKVFGKQLTQAQFNVLMVLKRNDNGGMAQKEILENLVSSKGNLSIHISNLAKMGLICKKISPRDSRMHEITLTDAGRELLAELEPLYMQHLNEISRVFPPDDAAKVKEVLGRIEEKCREVLARG